MDADVIVIGAGAAGMLAAGKAAERGLRVVLLERNERPGRKVMITGKGRCNVTNACSRETLISAVKSNGKFLYSAFSTFSPEDVMAFFERLQVPLKVERGNRVFPKSDRAADIVDALFRFAKDAGARFQTGRAESLLLEEGNVKGVRLCDGTEYTSRAAILCTGGLSYPKTGSTGDGYRLAKQAGHRIVDPAPSLVPLVAHEYWVPRLQGLSLKNVKVTVTDREKGKTLFEEQGEMLFTHFGLSGPLILSASAHIKDFSNRRIRIKIDLKPALSFEQLDARLQRDFKEYQNKDFANSLDKLLPRKLIPVIVELSGIGGSTKVNQITKEQRRSLAGLLKGLAVTAVAYRPIEEAIVTAGGVAVSEVSPKTMESKLCRGLYFAGEVLDVDAYTGGFNLQIAFSTGFLAGRSVLSEG